MTLPPHHAWTMRRLISGLPVNGELAELPEPFQAVARRLDALPLEARQMPWEAFLIDLEDRDEIIRTMAAVPYEGDRPEAPPDDETADDWGPIRLGTLPPAEPFPLDVLPGPMARLVIDGAEAIGCPPDLIALPVLVVAGGVIGRSVALKLKQDYFASACLWGATVAPPGEAKTPGWELASKAVALIDQGLKDDHRREMEKAEAEANNLPEGKRRSKPPPPPKRRRIDVDDITMEDVPVLLAENPRGLIRLVDELTSIMLGMNQYKGGKGNDRPIGLKLWSSEAIKKDRVGHVNNIPVCCSHPFYSIGGGIQPDMLGLMVDSAGRADGFMDRWLFAYPDSLPIPEWTGGGVPDAVNKDWCDLVGRLWARLMNDKEGRSVPHVAFLTPEGETAWIAGYNAHSAEMNAPDFPPSLKGPWGKFREYAGRLALVLACVHHAADPALDPADSPWVGPQIVRDAWRLVDYFKAHARRIHGVIDLGPGAGGDAYRAIVQWVRKGGRPSFSESEFTQARRWVKPGDLAAALKALIRRNVIREAPAERDAECQDGKPKGGRPPSPVYLVNPALFDPENPENP